MEYKYNDEHIDLMKEQVWECKKDLSIYGELSDFELEQFKDYLPHQAPYVHLEFGCGLGRGTIQLYNKYLSCAYRTYHILVDRNGRTENRGLFFPDEDEYYNNAELTLSFMDLNGLEPGDDFTFYDSEDPNTWTNIESHIGKVDLVTSRCSLGFHVPIDRYIDRLISVSNPEVTMIFGVNGQTPPTIVDRFTHLFEEVTFVPGKVDSRFPLQHWLILKRLK